jgi:4-hydroxy-tetrahydrodipicolinate synthase
VSDIAQRLDGALIAAVPVPFRGTAIDAAAQRSYAAWMAAQHASGVAVWAHTGRGPHLSADQKQLVLESWREALPDRLVVAGAADITDAIAARRGKADALLAFPVRGGAVAHHDRLSRELPVIAFWLYEAAGGVAYDDATLHAILSLPRVVGIKVATLDSIMTYQRIAAIVREHPDKVLITGEDRFLGYSIQLGARAALIGMAAGLTNVQRALLDAFRAGDWERFLRLSAACDAFAQATFVAPMEGYIRRMLWAAAEEGAIPAEACDDPWGPPLPESERDAVRRALRDAYEAAG